GQGYALWHPEPHTSGEVQIADVGHIVDGAFIRLFNVLDSDQKFFGFLNKPVPNPDVLPEGATQSRDVRNRVLIPGSYRSDGVEETSGSLHAEAYGPGGAGSGGLEAGFACKRDQGAVLVLNSAAKKEIILDNYRLRRYIRDHHTTWCQNISHHKDGPGLVVQPENVIFVYGWVKTSPNWKATTFCNSKTRYFASVDVQVGPHFSAGGDYHRANIVSGPQLTRTGTSYPSATQTEPQDQCVFLSGYTVKWRLGIFPRLRAAAGYHQLPDDRDGRSGDGGEGVATIDVPDEDEFMDDIESCTAQGPLNDLLEYILEVSDAEVAIGSDEDIESILLDQPWPEDMASYLRQTRPTIEIQEGMGMISLLEKVQRERERQFHNHDPSESDKAEYPDIGTKEAGTLGDGRVLFGPSQTKARTVDWKHLKLEHKDVENGAITYVSMCPSGKLLAAAWDDITITVWRLQDGLTVQHLGVEGHEDTIWSIAFSPDSKHIVSGSADALALVWDVGTGDIDVMAVAYSLDGALIATGSSDHSLRIWGALSGALLYSFEDLGSDIKRVVFSPDGSRLAACSDVSVTVWDPREGARIATLPEHNSAIWCMAFSPNSDRIVTGSEDSSARVWDASSGEVLVELHEHTSSVCSAAFSPDGSEVATASQDGIVVTCNSWTGERRFMLGDDVDTAVEAVAYSSKNDFIAAGAADGRVRVWNSKSGSFFAEFQGHEGEVKNVMFAPNGWDLLSYAEDGSVRSWSVLDALRLS
ncbi:uncharacterized protein PHACADRAFT_253089, partial [Phanerochaete carnosa HHB-10118-sp]